MQNRTSLYEVVRSTSATGSLKSLSFVASIVIRVDSARNSDGYQCHDYQAPRWKDTHETIISDQTIGSKKVDSKRA